MTATLLVLGVLVVAVLLALWIDRAPRTGHHPPTPPPLRPPWH